MKTIVILGSFILGTCIPTHGSNAAPPSANAAPIFLDQGSSWTAATRADFYTRDQGSRVMPLKWMSALKQKDGQSFISDGLARYGYLPNPSSVPSGLPIGFNVASSANGPEIGMTCAACHTRQIDVGGVLYRIDGGPAIVDFGSFLVDLNTAVGSVTSDSKVFDDFAVAVLGPSSPLAKKAQLRADIGAWNVRFDTLLKRALPSDPWGPARVDAVGMIFNRLSGLDIGPPPTHMIPDNIHKAAAPVRYPFLWNAAIQDKTQWPGFADNGSDILGLARNLGEVYGVFAEFIPRVDSWRPLGIDYWDDNSANIHGLQALEDLVRDLGPPKWPWGIDMRLALQGKAIFARDAHSGGCAECHAIRSGTTRFFEKTTWCTPVQDVGTDLREYDVLNWDVNTGVLKGAKIPFLKRALNPTEKAFNVLGTAVVGSIIQYYVPVGAEPAPTRGPSLFTPETEELRGAFNAPFGTESAGTEPGVSPLALTPTHDQCHATAPSAGAYESRVLEGIWATAPYLHNGSVPSLAELLKPASQRVAQFKIGSSYDTVNVGLSPSQDKFDYVLKTTDCSDRASGNSRCGHEFGTSLSDGEKRALLEYLKSL